MVDVFGSAQKMVVMVDVFGSAHADMHQIHENLSNAFCLPC